jgi:hypothetical protein
MCWTRLCIYFFRRGSAVDENDGILVISKEAVEITMGQSQKMLASVEYRQGSAPWCSQTFHFLQAKMAIMIA